MQKQLFSLASVDLCGLEPGPTVEELKGLGAEWALKLFGIANCSSPLVITVKPSQRPQIPVPLNLCLKMKDMSNGESFLILLLTERGERKREKGALEPNFPSCSTSSVFFRPWATYWRKRHISGKIPRVFFFFPFPPLINQRPHPLFLAAKEKAKGKHEGARKEGFRRQLLERLVRDFQPLTSVRASSPP